MDPREVFALIAIGVTLGLAGYLCYMLGQWKTQRRIGHRDVGIVTDDTLTFVLDDLDYTIRRDRDKREDVALDGARYRHLEDGPTERFSVSLRVNAGTPAAGVLHEIYREGALQCALRPFKQRGKENTATETE